MRMMKEKEQEEEEDEKEKKKQVAKGKVQRTIEGAVKEKRYQWQSQALINSQFLTNLMFIASYPLPPYRIIPQVHMKKLLHWFLGSLIY